MIRVFSGGEPALYLTVEGPVRAYPAEEPVGASVAAKVFGKASSDAIDHFGTFC